MSHPLLVEAAETLFVPVAIKNNTEDDADAAVRERFKEPSWNNPVVRIMDAEGKDLTRRLHKREDWSTAAVFGAMVEVLDTRKDKDGSGGAPLWLKLVSEEARAHARGVETAIFGMD